MPTQQFNLKLDAEFNEWRLQKAGEQCAESIFETRDEALQKLPDAIGPDGGTIAILGADGQLLDKLVIE